MKILQVAQDSNFSGTTNGTFKYIGTETVVKIPHIIKGVTVTSYKFNSTNKPSTLTFVVKP